MNMDVDRSDPRSVYSSPRMANRMTRSTTTASWDPVPIRAEKRGGLAAGLNTSPWTCFQP